MKRKPKRKFKTKVVPAWKDGKFTVQFTIGVQSFKLNVQRSKRDAMWYRARLNTALDNLQTGKDL